MIAKNLPSAPHFTRYLSPSYWYARLLISRHFDAAYYLRGNPDVAASRRKPLAHFVDFGWREGRNPSPDFDTTGYLAAHRGTVPKGTNPYLHYLRFGRAKGLTGRPGGTLQAPAGTLASQFDAAWYASCFPDGKAPKNLIDHYLTRGWREGLDPTPWFSTRRYLARNPDVAAAGINPFVHYLEQGKKENRPLGTTGLANGDVFQAHAQATTPGPLYEEFDAKIATCGSKQAKAIAYYLPQFHPTDENDEFWGKGFTEWRNVARGLPRFKGHQQPHLPRDLGFYSLDAGETYRRQIDLAKAAGLHAFCFYYYWFNGKRVLHKPLERMLADDSLDFPFLLMWANESWSRTWDGQDSEVLLSQDYDDTDDAALVADFARHFNDKRYMRVDGRPLLFIYRPGHIPDAKARIARWRKLFAQNHGINPIIAMAQGFGDSDPRAFGLDGAIEFPPHKLALGAPTITAQLDLLDPNFSGHVVDYDRVVGAAKAEAVPDYPLIRCTLPHWDNEARRPGRGFMLHGGTPAKFRDWLDWAIGYARENPFFGEEIIAVNAWNEWAEGAYLEPDVHTGAAYLNAFSEAVHACRRPEIAAARKLLLVGHDANRNGAQTLLLHIGQVLTRQFGLAVEFALLAGGPMLAEYQSVAPVHVLPFDPAARAQALDQIAARGFSRAITNTTACGTLVPDLKAKGFQVMSLIHELPGLIRSYGLQDAAGAIAAHADHVVFPAEVVRDGFLDLAGPLARFGEIRPQGLYKSGLLDLQRADLGLRAELGLPGDTRLVIGMGYGDLRKGIDRFFATALALCAEDQKIACIWVGDVPPDLAAWHLADVAAAGLSDRVRLTGHCQDVARWLQVADLFFLTSREDPFPSVVLEAMATGLPVVGYRGTGGMDELIRSYGALLDATDPANVVAIIRCLLDAAPAAKAMAGAERRALIARDYDFDRYVFALLQSLSPEVADISVIVPNYNYAQYLPDRLASVFDQNVPVREVIVLDDASTDSSLDVIAATARAAGRKIRPVPALTNSGSVFRQWQKGVDLAQGEYVWIAEADDLADPSLLARLVQQLEDGPADIAFCDSWQIDETGARLGDSYQPYLNQLEPRAFEHSFDMDGEEFLRRHLAVRNVILNASGVLFRKSALESALKATAKELPLYAIAGDWRLYAEICLQGGRVAYEATALNGHRRHASSVTHALNAARHLEEIHRVQGVIASRLRLDPATRLAQAAHLEHCAEVLGVSARQTKAA